MGNVKTNNDVQTSINGDRRRFFRALGASAIGAGTLVAAVSADATEMGTKTLPPAARKQALSEHQKKYFRTARI